MNADKTVRYFVRCAYNGTHYHGWQAQNNTPNTVQGEIERTLSIFLPDHPEIIGCGRTDAGVHASEYYFHFDSAAFDVGLMKYKLNSILPHDMVIMDVMVTHPDAHSRYDAVRRGYTYLIVGERDPFRQHTTYRYPTMDRLDRPAMHEAAALLLDYTDFETFCKNGSDENHKRCTMYRSEWTMTEDTMTYTVEANRFLRGMIRLIVGMCLNVGRGKVTIPQVKHALENQARLHDDWSVPAKGLFLNKVAYPYISDHAYIELHKTET